MLPCYAGLFFCMHDLIRPLDSPPFDRRKHGERAECARSLYPAGTIPFDVSSFHLTDKRRRSQHTLKNTLPG